MPPAPPATSVAAGTREQAEVPCAGTPPGSQDSPRPRKRNARAFLTRRKGLRADRTSSYCDPLFGQPDLVENDYYRFRNHAEN